MRIHGGRALRVQCLAMTLALMAALMSPLPAARAGSASREGAAFVAERPDASVVTMGLEELCARAAVADSGCVSAWLRLSDLGREEADSDAWRLSITTQVRAGGLQVVGGLESAAGMGASVVYTFPSHLSCEAGDWRARLEAPLESVLANGRGGCTAPGSDPLAHWRELRLRSAQFGLVRAVGEAAAAALDRVRWAVQSAREGESLAALRGLTEACAMLGLDAADPRTVLMDHAGFSLLLDMFDSVRMFGVDELARIWIDSDPAVVEAEAELALAAASAEASKMDPRFTVTAGLEWAGNEAAPSWSIGVRAEADYMGLRPKQGSAFPPGRGIEVLSDEPMLLARQAQLAAMRTRSGIECAACLDNAYSARMLLAGEGRAVESDPQACLGFQSAALRLLSGIGAYPDIGIAADLLGEGFQRIVSN